MCLTRPETSRPILTHMSGIDANSTLNTEVGKVGRYVFNHGAVASTPPGAFTLSKSPTQVWPFSIGVSGQVNHISAAPVTVVVFPAGHVVVSRKLK